MRPILTVAARELGSTFATPVATVFIVIFLVLQGAMTFNLGNFFERGQADLNPFFSFLPWVLMLLVPAIAMRMWAEERRLGTVELLFSLPVTQGQAVLGKFLAGWIFCIIAIALTFPFILTVAWLGNPDPGPIIAGYVGAVLIAGAFLSIGCAASALSKSQVIAFVIAIAICATFAAASTPLVAAFLGRHSPTAAGLVNSLGLVGRFAEFTRGVISLRNVIFFGTFMGFWLFVTALLVDARKAA